jgi:predicted phosphate transport protein (TIGR00153 family)
MLIFKKEKQARKLALAHFAKTEDCLTLAGDVLKAYLSGDREVARGIAIQVVALESDADHIKHELRDVLFSGAFLPNIRSDVYRLVDSVDKVANKAETTSHFIVNQRPQVPEQFQSELLRIYSLCFECYTELRVGLRCFFKPKGEMESLRVHAARVGELETEVDNLQAELTRSIFESDMDLGQKVHLSKLLELVARIADSAEDAADELQFAAMKSII